MNAWLEQTCGAAVVAVEKLLHSVGSVKQAVAHSTPHFATAVAREGVKRCGRVGLSRPLGLLSWEAV